LGDRFNPYGGRRWSRLGGWPAGLSVRPGSLLGPKTHTTKPDPVRLNRLLTGDYKHFGPLLGRSIGGVKVVSMRMLADEIDGRAWLGGRDLT
jgi:hypothetical protein